MEVCLVGNFGSNLSSKYGGMVGWNFFCLDTGWGFLKEFWLELLKRPPAGGIRRILLGKHESEALGGADGDVVGWSKRGYHSVKQTGPGLVNVLIGCWVGSVDGCMLRGAKTKVVCSYALKRPH